MERKRILLHHVQKLKDYVARDEKEIKVDEESESEEENKEIQQEEHKEI